MISFLLNSKVQMYMIKMTFTTQRDKNCKQGGEIYHVSIKNTHKKPI
jgi:hypothetical protein